MLPEILDLSDQALDLVPKRDIICESLQLKWSKSVPRHSLLLRHRHEIILTDRQAIGLLGAPSKPWVPLELALDSWRSSALGDLALADNDGGIYLWNPPNTPRRMLSATEPGFYSAASLGGSRLLILRFSGETMQEAYAIDAEQNHVLWRTEPGFHIAAVTAYGILVWTADFTALVCLSLESGLRCLEHAVGRCI